MPTNDKNTDSMHKVNELFKTLSRGKIELEWKYAPVTLAQKKPAGPACSAENNFQCWCNFLPPYNIPATIGTGQGFDDVMNDALHQAKIQDCQFEQQYYDLHIVVFPEASGQGCHGAVADVAGSNAWFNGYGVGTDGVMGTDTLAHEIGHMLGLFHSKYVTSTAVVEYGDTTDMMGAATKSVNAAFQHYLGWLGPDDVQVIRRSGIYRLFPTDTGGTIDENGLAHPSSNTPITAYGKKAVRALILEKDVRIEGEQGAKQQTGDSGALPGHPEYYYAAFNKEGM
jgi:hypothetical protein